MPFKSKQQMKACFATNGFGGKVDCEEWAKDTNYKSLPKKKKEDGGSIMYRPKNCKKCGGKMQTGGLQPYTQSNTAAGSTTPTGQSSLAQNSQLSPAQMQALAQQYGFRTDSNQNLQQDLFNYAQTKQPAAYNQVMQKYGQTNAGSFVDGLLGARTADLLGSLTPPPPSPQPYQAQANLTEHYFGPDKHALGIASQKYRDSQAITDPGVPGFNENPDYVDFQFYQPNTATPDDSRGRYKIPYSVWANQISRGTTTVGDPSLIEQYRVGAPQGQGEMMATNPIKMKGGRLRRMQTGGAMPQQKDYPDYESWQQAVDGWMSAQMPSPQIVPQQQTMQMLQGFNQPLQESDIIPGVNAPMPEAAQAPMNRVQEGIQKGIIEGPHGQNAQEWYNYINTPAPQQPKKNKNPFQTLQNVGIGMQAARTGLGWLSGMVERGRQNQYDYQQQTALGQMNPMQSSDFQPNPYDLYMKMGGNLKTILADYNKWSNNAGPMDMTEGKGNPEMKKGGYEIDRMIIVRKLLPELLNFGRLGSNYKKYRGFGGKL
jgi:hypothetical protein